MNFIVPFLLFRYYCIFGTNAVFQRLKAYMLNDRHNTLRLQKCQNDRKIRAHVPIHEYTYFSVHLAIVLYQLCRFLRNSDCEYSLSPAITSFNEGGAEMISSLPSSANDKMYPNGEEKSRQRTEIRIIIRFFYLSDPFLCVICHHYITTRSACQYFFKIFGNKL